MIINSVNNFQNPLVENTSRLQTNFTELSTAKKSFATTSPATLMIGEGLLQSARLLAAENSNFTNQISFNQTRSSVLSGFQDQLSRISELSVRANSGILNAQDREALNIEAQEIAGSIQQTADTFTFNDLPLLDIPEVNDLVSKLGSIDLTSSAGIIATADLANSSLDEISGRQAVIGSETRALSERVSVNRDTQANLMDAGTNLVGVDIALAATQLASSSVMQDIGIAMSGQAASIDSSTVAALLS